MSHPSVTPAKPPLAARIESEKSHPLAWKTVAKRAVVVVIAGVSIYLVFPAITEVLASWPRLSTLDPRWFAVAVGAEIAHFFCTFALQRLAMRTRAWFPVITSQLAGNAVTLIMPGGAAVGAALQFRMLAKSGSETDSTVGGLAAFSLLGVGGLLALPVWNAGRWCASRPASRCRPWPRTAAAILTWRRYCGARLSGAGRPWRAGPGGVGSGPSGGLLIPASAAACRPPVTGPSV